MTLSQDFIV